MLFDLYSFFLLSDLQNDVTCPFDVIKKRLIFLFKKKKKQETGAGSLHRKDTEGQKKGRGGKKAIFNFLLSNSDG